MHAKPIAMCAAIALVTMNQPCRTAAADDKVVLGGGAGITVAGTPCTLTTIGHDKSGDLVGFTADRCGGPGAAVVADDNPVGQIATTHPNLAYSVIKFDTAKVTPTANFSGFAVNGFGPKPNWGQTACTHSVVSGDGCGRVDVDPVRPNLGQARTPNWNPGDDGEPVTVDGLLVGLTNSVKILPNPPGFISWYDTIVYTFFSAVIDDANANGGPGAGFAPIPA